MPHRKQNLALAAMCALPFSLPAQDNSMPGMSMPAAPQPATPLAKKTPPAKSRPNLQLPADSAHPAPADKPADAETRSLQNSEQQQRQQPAAAGPASDTQSITHNTLSLQEAENPALHTGQDLPAPELLNDVSSRPPLTLANFEDWADHTNPTLAEADALIRRSAAQARQAGLPPNPSIGYSGEQYPRRRVRRRRAGRLRLPNRRPRRQAGPPPRHLPAAGRQRSHQPRSPAPPRPQRPRPGLLPRPHLPSHRRPPPAPAPPIARRRHHRPPARQRRPG